MKNASDSWIAVVHERQRRQQKQRIRRERKLNKFQINKIRQEWVEETNNGEKKDFSAGGRALACAHVNYLLYDDEAAKNFFI
jgi:ABC-type lipopolysaccharide export system ATPase subunit